MPIIIEGTESDDVISSTANGLVIFGIGGNDTLTGGDGIDQLYGGTGNDILNGGLGNDLLYGETGNDKLYGGLGLDNLFGGAGDDYLSGGDGIDNLYGGLGNDLYGVDHIADDVFENVNEGIDTVNTTLLSYTLGANVENLTYPGSGNFTGIGNELNNVIRSGAGDDYLSGRGGDDYLVAGAGDDLYGVDSDGDTVVEYANGGIDTVNTTLSSYALGANVENLIYPGSGTFTGYGNSLNNVIRGGRGLNALYAGDGNDTVIGNVSSDTIRGGSGSDVLTGGGGSDVFEFLGSAAALGRDRVTDFGTDDTLLFQGNFSTAQQVLNNARQVGADTVITLDANNSITLSNFARASLTAGNIYIVPPGGAALVALAPDNGFGFEKTLALGSSIFDDSFGADDAFSFDLDALIDGLVPRSADAVKSDSGAFATAERIEDVSALFVQDPDAGQAASFDFVSASHVQLVDHGAVFAIA